MSTSAVHQRVRRLEQRGVVKGYTAKLDYSALGQQMTAFISITPLDPAAPDDIPERLHEVPQIEECHSVAGDENYILKVRVVDAARARGADRHRPGRRQRLDPHDGRALDAVGVSGPTGLSADLQRYLQQGRDGLLRSLDGVSEYDARRPLTPSGTNLLGLVKHVAGVELGYLVESVGREAPVLPWNEDGSVWEGADMWALADREPRVPRRPLPLGVGATRRLDRRAAARRPGDRRLVAGGASRDHLRAPASCGASPRPRSTPATPTSCGRGSTARAGATTTTWATRPPGRSTSRASSRRPTRTGDGCRESSVRSGHRPMSASTAPVTRTRSVGESPRSSPRRPPDT